jgi:hypothetical protein
VREFLVFPRGSGAGIIDYLAHRGKGWLGLGPYIRSLWESSPPNVQDRGIVTITSKSADPAYPAANVAALDFYAPFCSTDEPNQWICWDFHEVRVRLTHYRLATDFYLKSWVVEGSVDGELWNEMDRRTDSAKFEVGNDVNFPVSKPSTCRFIRLTQTGKRGDGRDCLSLTFVEFYGRLFE